MLFLLSLIARAVARLVALTPVPARRYLAPATSEMEEGTVIRTRTAGLVGAMIPARLCCRMAMCVRMDAQVRVRP